MPKYSYGEKIQNRVKRLLEALLDYVNYEFEQNLRIEYKWELEDSNNLNITTTLRELVALTGKDKYDAKLTKTQIDYALKHYLKEYLKILRDNRTVTQGSDEWNFTLILWTRDKETILRKFDELWEEKRRGKSKDLATKERKEEDLWHEIFHHKIENQLEFIRHKATERGFEVNVHVPLGLVERKQQQRRDKDSSPNNPYELEKEVIVKTYEHDAFLKEVIGVQSTEKKKHIGITGEAGAGKTTLLSKVAEYLKDETEYLPIWISLANLQGETLENYLLETWFPSIESSKTTEQLKQRFSQGDIWLLLDGVDEMAENSPLYALKIEKLPDWLRKARFVLTCRLNVWDERINNPLTGFETYKTQEFKPEQVDEFIQNWFQCAESVDQDRALQIKLKESKHEKIRSLVTNPLRLSLLCQTFYLDKQGELPETKAGLYERFTRYFYEWKPENIPDELKSSDDKKDELHEALSKLALAGIDSDARFRLNRKFARKQMGEELFKLSCTVGWLNLVDRDAKTDQEVYAFFHANFQEYFAALAIDDWDYFLPRQHDNKPLADRYRIFEPQWKEVILLWLGRDEDYISDKEQFIEALVKFDDGCGDANFYGFQSYFLAAAGIAEYKNCSKADEIVAKIIRWGIGYFDSEQQEWLYCLKEIADVAKKALKETDTQRKTSALVKLIQQSQNKYIFWEALENLGKNAVNHPQVLTKVLDFIKSYSNELTVGNKEIFKAIYFRNQKAIIALTELMQNSQDEDTQITLASYIGKIDPGNSQAVNFIVKNLKYCQDKDKDKLRRAIYILGQIGASNQKALDTLLYLIHDYPDQEICITAIRGLDEIACVNSKANTILQDLSSQYLDKDKIIFLRILLKLNRGRKSFSPLFPTQLIKITTILCKLNDLQKKYHNEEECKFLEKMKIKICSRNQIKAVDALVELIRSSYYLEIRWEAIDALGEIGKGNQSAIDVLVELINNSEEADFRWEAVDNLGKIDSNNPIVIDTLIDLINARQRIIFPCSLFSRIGEFGYGNPKAINALLDLIQNPHNDYNTNAARSLHKILTNEYMVKVVIALKEVLSQKGNTNNVERYKDCIGIIWKCAQNMTYSELYQAWHHTA